MTKEAVERSHRPYGLNQEVELLKTYEFTGNALLDVVT